MNKENLNNANSVLMSSLFGLVSLIVLIGPLLIPGIDFKLSIEIFFVLTNGFCMLVCVAGIFQGLFNKKRYIR